MLSLASLSNSIAVSCTAKSSDVSPVVDCSVISSDQMARLAGIALCCYSVV